jgi:predicted dehydrogenase
LKQLRVAVIGAGVFGRNHVRAIRELPGIQVVGVYDIDRSRAEALGPALNSLEDVQADCAIVATPTITHEQVASQLLEAGLDVLVEKPIAAS